MHDRFSSSWPRPPSKQLLRARSIGLHNEQIDPRVPKRIILLSTLLLATLAAPVGPLDAQVTLEPYVGWTWEGQYYDWDRSSATGHSRVDVHLTPALTLGTRASFPIGGPTKRLAITYAQRRPELEVDYSFRTSREGSSSSSFGRLVTDATVHSLGLGLTYTRPTLPLSPEIGGAVFATRLSADTDRTPAISGRRQYDNIGVSLRASAGGTARRSGAPRIAIDIGAARTSGDVWIDFISLFTTADPDPQWAPFGTISGSWRFGF